MRILVTGASGFVGRHLVRHLHEVGDTVVGLGRQPTSDIVADLLDESATQRAISAVAPDAIFHLAGYADAGRSFAEPMVAWQSNLIATLNLLHAVAATGGRPRIITVATGMVYGRSVEMCEVCDESTPMLPNSPYGASKAAADLAAYQAFCNPGLPIIRVRAFNQIGPGQTANYAASNFARQLESIRRGEQPPILETGRLDGSRDLTDVRDMVRAYRLLLTHGTPGEAYNAASGRTVVMKDLAEMMVRLSGLQVEVRQKAELVRPDEVRVARVPAEKLRRATGWEPRISLEQSLRDVSDDWRGRELSPPNGIGRR